MGLVVRSLDENNNPISESSWIDCGNGGFLNPDCIKSINLENEDGVYIKTYKNTEIKMSEWRENPFCDDIDEVKKQFLKSENK